MSGLECDFVVHICLVWPMNETVGDTIGELHYMHWAAHGSETIGIKTAESTLLLGPLECEFPEVSVEPTNPIVKGCDPFQIKLLDESVEPTCRKIYPLSELELQELQS